MLLAALVVRVAGVGDRLSADEGYTWLVTSAHGFGTLLDRIAAFENTPPLYYLLTWPLPDGDEAWLRAVAVLAGVGCVAALWWAVRALADERAALLAAVALAVAPYAVSFSNYGRGFVLADLGLVIALGGAVRRSWWVYTAGAVVAVWSEYDAVLFLLALAFAIRPRRAELARLLAPLATLVLWLPEALRGLDAIDVTKVSPVYPEPSPASLRDLVVRLAFGEHGTAGAVGLRWLQFAAVAAVLVIAFRAAPRILWVTAAGTLLLHAVVAVAGPDVFAPRYLTELLPLAAGAVGIWLAQLRVRAAVPLAVGAMAALAVAVLLQRSGREIEPDVAALRPLVQSLSKNRVLVTNSPAVAYYLRDLEPRLDRPFGLGPGLERACVHGCRAGFVVVDDLRVAGGIRTGPGRARRFGPLYVRATPQVRSAPAVDQAEGNRLSSLACSLALLVAQSLGGVGVPHQMEVTVQDDALLLHRPPGEVQRVSRRLASLGADRVRITAGWSALAPAPRSPKRPAFDAARASDYPEGGFRQLDTAVKAATGAGLKVQLDLAFWAPRWAVGRSVKQKSRQRWRPDAGEFGRFAEAVARRYDGNFSDPTSKTGRNLPSVRLWTTWNEPNHPVFLMPQSLPKRGGGYRDIAPHVYRTMHEAAYDSLKRVNNANKVLIGGLSSRGASSPGPSRNIPPLRFIRRMACLDDRLEPLRDRACAGFRPLRADGFSYHPYSFEAAPDVAYGGAETVHLADLSRLSGLLADLKQRGRIANDLPLYLTEFGYESNPPDAGRGVAPETQARYMSQATFEAWRNPDVSMFAQFLLQDIGDPRSYQTGLLFHDGAEKPALQAFKLPFWAETRQANGQSYVLAFGQVRPGSGPQKVQIEAQGGDGVWRDVPSLPPADQRDGRSCPAEDTQFLTDDNGFYLRALPYNGVVNYRARWTRPDGGTEYAPPVTVGVPGGG